MKIMVLNDGETFSDLDGCHIYEVPDDMCTDDIEEALKEDTLQSVQVFHD